MWTSLPAYGRQLAKWLVYSILLILIIYPLLYDVLQAPIQTWDEARTAINAQEMHLSGHWLVTTYNNEPDLWNTKPPLLIWLQAGLMNLLGPSDLAIRLPSIIASVSTVLLLLGFSKRYLRDYTAGILASLILVTSAGYVHVHVARTGDYDALLICFLLLNLLSFFLYLESSRWQYILLWGITLAASIMTKGVAALLGMPALGIYVLLQGAFWNLVRKPALWLALLVGLGLPAVFYVMREHALPGYWQAVWENELGGRYTTALENHSHSWYWYLKLLHTEYFLPWLYLIPPAIVVLFFVERRPLVRRFALLVGLFSFCWLLVISSAQTKLAWYIGPAYPTMALLVGLALSAGYHQLVHRLPNTVLPWRGLFGAAALLVVFTLPYLNMLDAIEIQRYDDTSWSDETKYSTFVRSYTDKFPAIQEVVVIQPGGYMGSLSFYRKIYGERDVNINMVTPDILITNNLAPGTQIVICNPQDREKLLSIYNTTPVYEEVQCMAFTIVSHK